MVASARSRQRASHESNLSLSLLSLLVSQTTASLHDMRRDVAFKPQIIQSRVDASIPLVIENLCGETIWPAVASQAGTGPSITGFQLSSGDKKALTVGANWQGRVWGRTNCSFNAAGTGPSNPNGGRACSTGDCNGVLECVLTGDTPVTLFEALLAGGVNGKQTFYDISLVDGYNLPVGLTYLPGNNSALADIPPNLTNAACIATSGFISDVESTTTNASFPIPFNTKTTNSDLAGWCPWNLQVFAPTKPGDGVYPYPDDDIQRPVFDPCNSACASSNSPRDCCTGSYDSPDSCSPSLYSKQAKAVCPDAYSYAFDDQTSTFIIPSGGGWQVTFCPVGRSTNILQVFGKQLSELASTGKVSSQVLADSQNITIIQKGDAPGGFVAMEERRKLGSLGALVVLIAWLCMW